MKILILGSGGREHALAWAIKQNPKCDALICAPGNVGMAKIAECFALDIEDNQSVVGFCRDHAIDFVVIGPEAPLALGLADDLRAADFLTFGPSKAAAQLESSKGFTKEICDACQAPTAAYASFTKVAPAREYVRKQGAPIVIKADGLAAGKGVIVAMDTNEAFLAVDDILGGSFGTAGASVVIEEFLGGEEASLFVLCDGENLLTMGSAQDHKRAFDGDQGPNTGGMGAYSPAPVMTKQVLDQTMSQIIRPTIGEMARRGTPFHGVLFAGLMIKDGQPKLIEYNVRFGDPECQVLMMRLGAQALDALLACAQNQLGTFKLHWADDHALSVVMAASGYPGSYEKGTEINGLNIMVSTSKETVFHAGTSEHKGKVLATGGRVLAVTARADTLQQAHDTAYKMVSQIHWPQGFYRKDIGWRAL